MKILSLFDGMSCGQLAIDRIGIKNYTYYASEIDKYAIQIAKKNFPNTIHIGDVTAISPGNLPKIDLLIGGSPCQGFSFAGKQLAFDDPRSKLFFEYVRLFKELKPKYFLLENVRMKKEYLDIISEYLGVKPVLINSSLFSAQNRQRYYWTNIPFKKNIIDKGIVLKDILEEGFNTEDESYLEIHNKPNKIHDIPKDVLKDNERQRRVYDKNGKSPTLLARSDSPKVMKIDKPKQVGIATDINGHDILKRVYSPAGKSPTLTTMGGGHREPKVMIVPEKVKIRKHEIDIKELQTLLREHRKPIKEIAQVLNVNKTTIEHWFRTDSSFSIPDENIWFKLKELLNIKTDKFDKSITEFIIRDGTYEMANRVYNTDYKSPTVVSSIVSKINLTKDTTEDIYWRKLTPLECERLQTVPDNYTEGVSNTQRYKMLGNSFTVDVISHILKKMEVNNE